MATREAIKAAVVYMQGLFPNYHPALVGQWNAIDALQDALGDLDEAELMIAVRAACMDGTGREFAPSADQIRRALVLLKGQASGLPTAGESWGAVIGSFERMPGGNMCGGGRGPILDHPLVIKAINEMGGYKAIDYDEQMPARVQFMKLYQALLDKEITKAVQPPQVTAFVEAKRLEAGQSKLLEDNNG
jgi:hypothetical protein